MHVNCERGVCVTFSRQFPSLSCSHYWVVVIRLDDASTFDESGDPSSVYPDNNSFTNYSANIPPLRPYIAAEIRSDNYAPLTDFTLGDDTGTRGINDFPDRYRNGPLEQGSTYTAFVRAFSRIVPASYRSFDIIMSLCFYWQFSLSCMPPSTISLSCHPLLVCCTTLY